MSPQETAGLVSLSVLISWATLREGGVAMQSWVADKLFSRNRRSRLTSVVSKLDHKTKAEMFGALVRELKDQQVDRLFQQELKRAIGTEDGHWPGDLLQTSRGVCVVIDIAGNFVGPFETAAITRLLQSVATNPRLADPETHHGFMDLRIVDVVNARHRYTLMNGATHLYACDSLASALFKLDRVADAVSQIHMDSIVLGDGKDLEARHALAQSYIRQTPGLRRRGMIHMQDDQSGWLWTGRRWRSLPLGSGWAELAQAEMVTPGEIDTGVSATRYRGGVGLLWRGDYLARLPDSPDASDRLQALVSEVQGIICEVEEAGGYEPVRELVPLPATHLTGALLEDAEAVGGNEELRERFARAVAAFTPDDTAETLIPAFILSCDMIVLLEARIAQLEAGMATPQTPELGFPTAPVCEEPRRRAIRA